MPKQVFIGYSKHPRRNNVVIDSLKIASSYRISSTHVQTVGHIAIVSMPMHDIKELIDPYTNVDISVEEIEGLQPVLN